jgi:hypothetical protein
VETLTKLIGVINNIIGKIEKRDDTVEPTDGEDAPFKNLKSMHHSQKYLLHKILLTDALNLHSQVVNFWSKTKTARHI